MVEEIKILKGIDSTMKTMKRDKFLYYTGRVVEIIEAVRDIGKA
jgi:hypothetical protein